MSGCGQDHELCSALIDQMLDGVKPIITGAMGKTDDPCIQNMAVSAFGIIIAAATLRSVDDEEAAKRVATGLVRHFIDEVNDVMKEQWGNRDNPQ